MFTHKDIVFKTIFVVNCLEGRTLRVHQGELLLVEAEKVLTKFPFQKILALFIIGHFTITSPLIEKCVANGIAIIVMKPNLRPVFFFSITAEANFLLRKKQYEYSKENLTIPKVLVENKIRNQILLLDKTRIRTCSVKMTKDKMNVLLLNLKSGLTYEEIMGVEGKAANLFFEAYYEQLGWKKRCPRVKSDVLNSTLDIGYTILFNYIETFIRLFGFDPYRGVYHQLWFKRKSLVCDLVEPFRCIIDRQVRKAFNLKQCSVQDFELRKGEYLLKREKNTVYVKMFFQELINYKTEIFKYVQSYYRCFMREGSGKDYPRFYIK